MKLRFRMFVRGETFWCEDAETGKQSSLRTKDRGEAGAILAAKNEAFRQPALNLQIAQAYLRAVDSMVSTRTWRVPIEEIVKLKKGVTRERYEAATRDKAFDEIRDVPLLHTRPSHFLRVLESGTVATNVFLRRIHNFALDMQWLPWPILPKRQWPSPV